MATYTPPPYFPQGSLAPADKNRYRKFKLILAVGGLGLIVVLSALGVGVWYLLKWIL